MAKWYKIPMTWRVTEREYRANIDGINIVFGAVLGFVLAGAEELPTYDFVALLFVSAAIAILILYLGSSEYRLFYALAAAASIALLPKFLEKFVTPESLPKLQATLAVWAFMVLLVELLPREKTDPPQAKEEPNQ